MGAKNLEINNETQLNPQGSIHKKGFYMYGRNPEINQNINEYGRIKVGTGAAVKTIDDAALDLGSLKKADKKWSNKTVILKALASKDYATLREVSNYYYELSGIYERACQYFAFLYRYDWFLVPYVDEEKANEEKVLREFYKVLNYLDNTDVKKMCYEIALKVVINGCYYGYLVDGPSSAIIQELPVNYCRSRYTIAGQPAVEFNMAFFDEKFSDETYRNRILNLFPEEFKKGYALYKKGKLLSDNIDSTGSTNRAVGWYLLDPDCAVKFNLNGHDYPQLANAIPNILDLDFAQDLDKKKKMQQLQKIIVQTLPLDKNGDLIFDVDEARDIHNNAVRMLQRAVGVDVMTTFADTKAVDLSDSAAANADDELARVERSLYNQLGIAEKLFNTDGNLSLEKSILNDEAVVRGMLLQFQAFFNKVIRWKFPKKKDYSFRLWMLETTIYNYKEMSRMYKEQVQIGYSKMLPQVALGHSQSSIIAMALFENKVLHLSELMIPPLQSSVMNMDTLAAITGEGENQDTGNNEGGRPEKADDEKSEKTIANIESQG